MGRLGSEPAPSQASETEQQVEVGAIDIARYAVGSEIGRGAMARVMRAFDQRLGRDVAWKEASGPAAARLLAEARILARLEHPGIVPVHDVGTTPDGRVVLAMRMLGGRSLRAELEAPSAGEQRLLRVVLQVAEAMAFAHARGIVHRDLKPDNVVVGPLGETLVVDWGLARALGDAVPDDEAASRFSGTRGYASPEQLDGAGPDARDDVFALGTILAEATASGARAPELAAIVARATAPRRGERYADAGALADDLLRHLEGRRVTAHSYSRRELVWRFARAFRWPIAATLAALAVLAAVIWTSVRRIEAEREAAERELARALVGEARRFAESGARPEAELAAARAWALDGSPDAAGVLIAQGFPARPAPLGAPVALPRCGTLALDREGRFALCGFSTEIGVIDPLTGRWRWRRAVANSGSFVRGDRIGAVVHTTDWQVRFFDAADGAEVGRATMRCDARPLLGARPGRVSLLRGAGCITGVLPAERLETRNPCPDRAVIAATVDHDEQGYLVACRTSGLFRGRWDEPLATPILPAWWAYADEPTVLVALAGDRLAAGDAAGGVTLIDLGGSALVVRAAKSETGLEGIVRLLEASPDGRWLALSDDRVGVRLFDGRTLVSRGALPAAAGTNAWFAAGSLFSAGAELRRWALPSAPGPVATLAAPEGVTALDPAGAMLVVAHGRHVRRIDPSDARVLDETLFVRSIAKSAAWDPTGARVLAASLDVPGVGPIGAPPLVEHATRDLGVLADGTVLIGLYDAALIAVDDRGARVVYPAAVIDLTVAPGRRVAAALTEPGRELLVIRAGAHVEVLAVEREAVAVAPAPDGERIYAAVPEGIDVHSIEGLVGHLAAPGRVLEVVLASGDGRFVAAGTRDGGVLLWHAGSGALLASLIDHRERVAALAFGPESADGVPAWLASGSWDDSVRLRDLSVLDAPPERVLADRIAVWFFAATSVPDPSRY